MTIMKHTIFPFSEQTSHSTYCRTNKLQSVFKIIYLLFRNTCHLNMSWTPHHEYLFSPGNPLAANSIKQFVCVYFFKFFIFGI